MGTFVGIFDDLRFLLKTPIANEKRLDHFHMDEQRAGNSLEILIGETGVGAFWEEAR